ncbi:hypothetical protein [Agrobacterium sp. CG674]
MNSASRAIETFIQEARARAQNGKSGDGDYRLAVYMTSGHRFDDLEVVKHDPGTGVLVVLKDDGVKPDRRELAIITDQVVTVEIFW